MVKAKLTNKFTSVSSKQVTSTYFGSLLHLGWGALDCRLATASQELTGERKACRLIHRNFKKLG